MNICGESCILKPGVAESTPEALRRSTMSDNRENKHNEEPHDSEGRKIFVLQETVKDEQRSKKESWEICAGLQEED